MVKFKNLFQFSQKDVAQFFDKSRSKAYIRGLRLIQVVQNVDEPLLTHGKLLIVTPRTSGKANLRNQLRRRLKDIFYRQELYKMPVIWIIIASRNAMIHSFDELKAFLIENITEDKQ